MEAAETAEAADLEGEAAEPLREGEAVDPPTLECNRSTHYRNLLYREGASNGIREAIMVNKESMVCRKGKLMNPCWGNTIPFCSSNQLPCLGLRPMKGFLS